MYNTNFKVKYNIIETELLAKLREKLFTKNEDENDDDEDEDYSEEDVLDICDKLYKDELLSVFNLEDLNDDVSLNKAVELVWTEVVKNSDFKSLISEIETTYFQELKTQSECNFEYIIVISFFSKQLFHITHNCICQQLESGTINNDLLVELKIVSMELFENKILTPFFNS
jgi:hypothetical protein